MRSITLLALSFVVLVINSTCTPEGAPRGINIFSVEDDINLGRQVDAEILSMPQEFPILDRVQYPEAYAHFDRITQTVLNSSEVYYRDRFDWVFRIVHDDNTLNAFAAPGGYIYIYTGLIKFLDAEHELAGVIAHEIAHADRRHTTNRLTKIYGISLLLDIVLGQQTGLLSDIAVQLAFLRFSRSDEREADDFSVRYLCPLAYRSDGAAAFFIKLEEEGMVNGPPQFLSTHPDPGDRVRDITEQAIALGCEGTSTFDARYREFKDALP